MMFNDGLIIYQPHRFIKPVVLPFLRLNLSFLDLIRQISYLAVAIAANLGVVKVKLGLLQKIKFSIQSLNFRSSTMSQSAPFDLNDNYGSDQYITTYWDEDNDDYLRFLHETQDIDLLFSTLNNKELNYAQD